MTLKNKQLASLNYTQKACYKGRLDKRSAQIRHNFDIWIPYFSIEIAFLAQK